MADKQLAKEWFDTAVSDFQYAKVGLEEKQVFPQVAFLSQQVAEKFLKGFLVLHGQEPPRIHDLPKLLDAGVKIQPKLEKIRDACELLAGFYVEVRYPPDIPDYTKEEIVQAFDSAKLVKDTVESLTGKI